MSQVFSNMKLVSASKRQLVLSNSGGTQIIDNISCVFGPKQVAIFLINCTYYKFSDFCEQVYFR